MSTHPYRFEIIVAGFAHLIWLTILALSILSYPFTSFLDAVLRIDSGFAVIVVALMGGLSVYLGNLSEHLFVVFSYVAMNSSSREMKCREYSNSPENIWTTKSFFRSMSFAVLFNIIILLFVNKNESFSIKCTIWVIGLLLEIPTLICFSFWWYIDNKVNK